MKPKEGEKMKVLSLCAVGLLMVSTAALAQTEDFNSSKSDTSAVSASKGTDCNDDNCTGTDETRVEDHKSSRSNNGQSETPPKAKAEGWDGVYRGKPSQQ